MRKKQLFLLLPILAIWLLPSCTADKPEPDITQQSIKKLKKIIGFGPDDYRLYNYGTDGQVTNIINKWFNGSIDTSFEISISYNQGKRTSIIDPSYKIEFNYPNETTTTLTYHSLIYPNYYIGTMKLDNKKRVIEYNRKDYNSQWDSLRVLFYYYPDGNLKQVDSYYNGDTDNELELAQTELYESYDKKINPERYLFSETDYTLFGDLIINNPTRVVTTSFFSNQQMVNTYQYQYDEDGYPISKFIQITNDGVPGNTFNLKYEYY